MFTTFGFCRRSPSLAVFLLVMLVLQGCSKKSEGVSQNDVSAVDDADALNGSSGTLVEAFAIANTPEHARAVTMLAEADVGECVRNTAHETFKMSEREFMSLSNEKRAALQSEMIQMAGLIKEAAYMQIDRMKEARDSGKTEDADRIESNIRRLVSRLRNGEYVSVYQGFAGGIELKLNESLAGTSNE